jgi:microcystin-dependent protein
MSTSNGDRPSRVTPVLQLPVPGDANPADAPADIGALADRLEALMAAGAIPAPGDYKFTASQNPPGGWVLCDGRALDRGVYSALFNAIGTQFGAPDAGTFTVPDLRGCIPMGEGQGPGLTARVRGQRLGAETHVLTQAQLPNVSTGTDSPDHSHVSYRYQRTDIQAGTGAWVALTGWGTLQAMNATTGAQQRHAHALGGANQAHNNVQPSVVVGSYYMKT